MYRRSFVKIFAMGLASIGLGPVAVANAGANSPKPGSKRAYKKQVGAWFYVDNGQWQTMQLVSVTDGPTSTEVNQFTLMFRANADVDLEEGTYSVQSDQGDDSEMFLQPAGEWQQDRYFKAPFAKLKNTQ